MSNSGAARVPGEGVSPATHLRVLAILSVAGGLLVLVAGLVVALGFGLDQVAGSVWMGPWFWVLPGVATSLMGLFVFVGVVVACASVVGGVGLLLEVEWGRVVTLIVAVAVGVLGVLTLTFLPLVFALYGVWVLTRRDVVEGFVRPVREGDLLEDGG